MLSRGKDFVGGGLARSSVIHIEAARQHWPDLFIAIIHIDVACFIKGKVVATHYFILAVEYLRRLPQYSF